MKLDKDDLGANIRTFLEECLRGIVRPEALLMVERKCSSSQLS
jgi:hypothetical protein